MARNNGGVFGQLRGKIGDVVFSVSRGEQTSRRYQPVVNNPKSPKQIDQRNNFATAVRFVKKQCRYLNTALYSKKYHKTTPFAQLVQSSLTNLNFNYLPSVKLKKSFLRSWAVKSDYGPAIPNIANILVKGSGDSGMYTFGYVNAGAGEKYIGLSLPFNFYANEYRNLAPKLFIKAIVVDRKNEDSEPYLTFYDNIFDAVDGGIPIQTASTVASDYRMIDGVVQANCGIFNTPDETGAQYYIKVAYNGAGWWTDGYLTQGMEYVDENGDDVTGNGVIYWAEDNQDNVFSSRTNFLTNSRVMS